MRCRKSIFTTLVCGFRQSLKHRKFTKELNGGSDDVTKKIMFEQASQNATPGNYRTRVFSQTLRWFYKHQITDITLYIILFVNGQELIRTDISLPEIKFLAYKTKDIQRRLFSFCRIRTFEITHFFRDLIILENLGLCSNAKEGNEWNFRFAKLLLQRILQQF